MAAEPGAIKWAGKDVETLFICLPDTSAGGPGGVKTVFIVVDPHGITRAQFSVCRVSVVG